MQLETIKKELKDLIKKDKLALVLEQLDGLPLAGVNRKRDLINLIRRLNRYNDQRMRRVETRETIEKEFNILTFAIMDFVDDLELEQKEMDLKIEYEEVDTKILVLSFSDDAQKDMKRFFAPLNFTNLDYKVAQDYDSSWNSEFIITIWDNRDLPECPKRDQENLDKLTNKERDVLFQRLPMLEDCLLFEPSPHFIHLGEPLFFVRENRDRIYAANSFYALFARVNEMNKYINTYRARVGNQ